MKVFVYGAGGHGKVVADIILAAGEHEVLGLFDDNVALHGATVMDLSVIGGREEMKRESARGKVGVALGIGNNGLRQRVAESCAALGVEIIKAIHPSAVISPSAQTGAGTVVMAGAVVNPCAQLGLAVIVNSGAVIEHDVFVGDYAHVSPNAVMGGESRLGMLSHLGLGAVLLPGIVIG